MNPLVFRRQPLSVRPHHYETPHSYLDRLCVANIIDKRLITNTITKRRKVSTGERHHHLALVIRDLGGPEPSHFTRSYLLATQTRPPDNVEKLLAKAFQERRTTTRWACSYCTAGEAVATFDHHQFNVCLKHCRWLAPGFGVADQRRVPNPAAWVRAERRHRRSVGTRFVTDHLLDTIWQIVRDQAAVLGPPDWADRLDAAQTAPVFLEGVDDRLALYPETTRIIGLLSTPRLWAAVDSLSRSPERLRAYLRRELAWVPGQQWTLVEALTEELIRSRRSRIKQLEALMDQHFDELARRHPASKTRAV